MRDEQQVEDLEQVVVEVGVVNLNGSLGGALPYLGLAWSIYFFLVQRPCNFLGV